MIGTDYQTWSDDVYFAEERDEKKFASAVFSAMDQWVTFCETNGLADRWEQNMFLYHGVDPKQTDDNGFYTSNSFRITGDQGELLSVAFNDYRNLLQHVLNMTVSQPPNMTAKAINDDAKSLVAAQTFDSVFEFYMTTYRSGRLLRQSKLAVEGALYQDMGSVLVEWDEFGGDIVGDDANGNLVPQGDLYFKYRSVWDAFYDAGVEEEDEIDWVCVRDQINKYECARRYANGNDELRQKIIRHGKSGSRLYSWRRGFQRPTKTDMIDVYKFYHRPTLLMPQGRYAVLLDPETVLNKPAPMVPAPMTDAASGAMIAPEAELINPADCFVPNPYDCLPFFSVRAMEQPGGILGYAPGNVIAPVQMSQNVLDSAAMTNFAMFGVQNIAVKDGDAFDVETLAGGMNIVKYIEQPPIPLQMTAQAQGLFDFRTFLKTEGELLSGINSVIRGEPEASLKSGKALGIVQAQAVQFQSSLAASYAQFLKNIGNFMLQVFRKYVKAPRIVQIAGENAVMQSAQWDASTFGPINRVSAELVDPAMRTLGYKTDLADKLLTAGLIPTAKEYLTVVTTGQLKPLYRGEMAELNLIHQENEDMVKLADSIAAQIEQIRATVPPEQSGQLVMQLAMSVAPPVLEDDNDELHMLEHKAVTASPATRRNGAVTAIAMAHKQAHMQNMAMKAQQQLAMQAQVQGTLAIAQNVGQPQKQEPESKPPQGNS